MISRDLAPHIAGSTDLTASGTVHYIARMLRQWKAGIKPASIVNTRAHSRRMA